MQAIARHSVMIGRLIAYAVMLLGLFGGASAANGMAFDHTERIEAAAADVGCAIGKIGKGRKRGSEMVYRVTCNADGSPSSYDVACKLNRCILKDDETRER